MSNKKDEITTSVANADSVDGQSFDNFLGKPIEPKKDRKEKRKEKKRAEKRAKRSKPKVVLTFDRWFASTGKPAHHKAGMRAYINDKQAKGKKTVAEWERLFAGY